MQVPTRQKFGLKVASFGLRGPSELTFGRSRHGLHRSRYAPIHHHHISKVSYRIVSVLSQLPPVSYRIRSIGIEYSPDPIQSLGVRRGQHAPCVSPPLNAFNDPPLTAPTRSCPAAVHSVTGSSVCASGCDNGECCSAPAGKGITLANAGVTCEGTVDTCPAGTYSTAADATCIA